MGTVLHRPQSRSGVAVDDLFQSPSRWGRCCIATVETLVAGRYGVSVPFSMGTVLHRAGVMDGGRASCECFSPLLDGDGVASRDMARVRRYLDAVSVPFSMGTVLHLGQCRIKDTTPERFSPLLDGDGVASG